MAIERGEILTRLRSQIEKKIPIIGAGAGTGISAKFCEQGGVDLIIIYNSGRFRMAGRGSLAGLLPYGDANAIVKEMASEVLPVIERGRELVEPRVNELLGWTPPGPGESAGRAGESIEERTEAP